MRKQLIVAILFVLAGVAAAQKPRSDTPKARIAETESAGKGQIKPQAQKSDQSSPHSASPSPQPATPSTDKACQDSAQNIHIQRWLMYFTGALVVVGSLQVGSMIWQAILLWKTRTDVHTQAAWMERQAGYMAREGISLRRQTTLLRKSADAAESSARTAQVNADAANAQIQMMKNRERARISVTVDCNEFEVNAAYSFDAVPIIITNDGATSAFSVRAKADIFGQPGDGNPYIGNFISLTAPDVIRANNDPIQIQVILAQGIDFTGFESSNVSYYFHLGGIIDYEDIFGDKHTTTFRFRLQVTDIKKVTGSKSTLVKSLYGWKRFGDSNENRAT